MGYISINQPKPSLQRQSQAAVFIQGLPTWAPYELHGNIILSYLGHNKWQVNYTACAQSSKTSHITITLYGVMFHDLRRL